MGNLYSLQYLDDIIVFGKTWAEHVQRLRQVFQRIKKAQLKLKTSKCTPAQKEVKFLGHVVSEHGIAPDPEKLKAISAITPPQLMLKVSEPF